MTDATYTQLVESFRGLGLSEAAAQTAARGRGDVRPDGLAQVFESMGLSPSAAEAAARGRNGSPVARSFPRPPTLSESWRPEPGDAFRVVRKIEELAADLCTRGVEERKALREAAFTVFRGMPTDWSQEWVAKIIERHWPDLLRNTIMRG